MLGAGVGADTGTSFFEAIMPVLNALPALFVVMALSATALHIVSYFTDFASAESLANLMRTVKRILIVGSFVALLGAIVSWVLAGTGAAPAGSGVVTGL